MSKFTKIATGTIAALALTVGVLATSTNEAKAWGAKGWGPAIGLGIAAGVVAGAAYAASNPYNCRMVARYDSWGNYRGSIRVCDYY